jgi:type IV pilus assembly protein PilB
MGIEPFLVGSALDCVLAQRLARRLCSKCREPYTPEPETLIASRFPWQDGMPLPTLHRPIGCSACSKTGYRGRLALQEVMPITEEIERLAVERASAVAIERVAREQGMISLRDDGIDKVLQGVTTLEEILRVVA